MDSTMVNIKLSIPSHEVVRAVVEVGDTRGIYDLNVGEDEFGGVEITSVRAVVGYSGDYIQKIAVRVKGRIAHSYRRINNEYTLYWSGAFDRSFENYKLEAIDED